MGGFISLARATGIRVNSYFHIENLYFTNHSHESFKKNSECLPKAKSHWFLNFADEQTEVRKFGKTAQSHTHHGGRVKM